MIRVLIVVILLAGCDDPALVVPDKVIIGVPETLFIGAWEELRVAVALDADFTFADLEFVVVEGDAAGSVSISRPDGDDGLPDGEPIITLLAGATSGTFNLEARLGGVAVGSREFVVVDDWEEDLQSPPRWFQGNIRGSYAIGGAWGDDDGAVQAVNVYDPDPDDDGVRTLAILLIGTKDAPYPDDEATLDTIRTTWKDMAEDGHVVGTGATVSVREYYEELSNNALTVTADVYGPVSLPKNFDAYYKKKKGKDSWWPKKTWPQTCVTKSQEVIGDLTKYDTICCITRAVDTGDPPIMAWATASSGLSGPLKWKNQQDKTVDIAIGIVNMSNEFDVALTNRENTFTFAHEVGHNLGMPDLYKPALPAAGDLRAARNMNVYDLMDKEGSLPHLSLAHRLLLGWIHPDDIALINPGISDEIDETISLIPVEQIVPDDDRKAGIQIRLATGRNYYFEYRRGQDGQVGDRGAKIPQSGEGIILGSELDRNRATAPVAKPSVARLPPDGPILDQVDDLFQQDDFPGGNRLRVMVTDLEEDSAELWIRFGRPNGVDTGEVGSSPDPSIQPWPRDAEHRWQSSDIEVTNERSKEKAEWANVPWAGNPNTITASVKNSGTEDAANVQVEFWVMDYSVGPSSTEYLGLDEQNVAAGATVDFVLEGWQPPDDGGHHCIIVEIADYAGEQSHENNRAQSNYDRFIAKTSSPSSRVVTTVAVTNPYEEEAEFFINADQTHGAFRTYLETTALTLEPLETRQITIMFEYVGEGVLSQVAQNYVSLSGWILDPEYIPEADDLEEEVAMPTGGVDIVIEVGRRTDFEYIYVTGDESGGYTIAGAIIDLSTYDSVTGGKVLARIAYDDPDKPEYETAEVDEWGDFTLPLAPGAWQTIDLTYLAISPWADTEYETLTP